MAHLTPEDRARLEATMDETTWRPERKIVGGAIAVILMVILQAAFPEIDLPLGMEGAIGIVAAYLLPNRKTASPS